MNVLLVAFCALIIVYDLVFRRVPNSLLLIALLVHIGYLIVNGVGYLDVDVSQSLIGFAIALFVFVPLYALRLMGAGDVKFLMVLGALFGWKGLLVVWVMGSLIAGLHAVVAYSSNRWLMYMPAGVYDAMQRIGDSNLYQRMLIVRQGRKGTPYAAYLAVGVLFYLAVTWSGQ